MTKALNKRFLKPAIAAVSVIVVILFLLYGPIVFIRKTIITSAMTTLSHQWIATVLYSDKTIDKIMHENTIMAMKVNSDPRQIRPVDKPAKDFELIDISGKIFKGYLLKIYDSRRVHLVAAKNLG
jgi:exopolysaccharide biosynthesis protein